MLQLLSRVRSPAVRKPYSRQGRLGIACIAARPVLAYSALRLIIDIIFFILLRRERLTDRVQRYASVLV